MKKTFFLLLFLITIPLNSSTAFSGSNPLYKYQDELAAIKYYPAMMENYKKGEDIVVAIIDDGVWLQHPDLMGTTWVNNKETQQNGKDDDLNGYIDDYYGWNFINNNSDLSVKGSHGTGVAGLIAAQDNDIGFIGIAPKVKIMSLIVCDNNGCPTQAVSDAIIYAANNGADIINLSLGGSGYVGYKDDYNHPIQHAFNKGVYIVAAAGNGDPESMYGTGQNLSFSKASPVNNDVNGINMVLGVGASNNNGKMLNWSNYGNGVDILVPGENISVLSVPKFDEGYYYNIVSGTSFSAPMVSAAVALLKSQYPCITNEQVTKRLKNRVILDLKDILMDQETIYCKKNCPANSYLSAINTCVCNDGFQELNINGTLACHGEVNNNSISENSVETQNIIVPQINVDNDISSFLDTEKNLVKRIDKAISIKLKGSILLQVETHGEAWYVNPADLKKYYMANGNEAYEIMRRLSIGITNKDFDRISENKTLAKTHSGKIFIKVEDFGKAYYVDFDGQFHYLENGNAAYDIMRKLGAGISNNDIRKIEVGEIKF